MTRSSTKLRITTKGHYDKHDDVMRFTARRGTVPVSFSISGNALTLIARQKGWAFVSYDQWFALAGGEIESAAHRVFEASGADTTKSYFIEWHDVQYGTGGAQSLA